MESNKKIKLDSVDDYIALYPVAIKKQLQILRNTIVKAAPQAIEVISYNMPAYKLNGMLVWFAAHKNHIGLYPYANTIEEFLPKLKKYETSKGTIKFANSKPLPLNLITEIIKFNVIKNAKKETAKKEKKINNRI